MTHLRTASTWHQHIQLPTALAIHHVATATHMTVAVPRQWLIGLVQGRTTGAAMKDVRTIIDGSRSRKASPTKSDSDPAKPRTLRFWTIQIHSSPVYLTKIAAGEASSALPLFDCFSHIAATA